MNKRVIIYSDGACKGNPGPGGWGAILIYKEHEKEISGFEIQTTNNRMELMAAIEALRSLNRKSDVDLYTDSQYLKNGMTLWMPKWIENNWRKRHSGQIKNIDLWQMLQELANKHNIIWHWVRGHDTNEGNIRADKLAVKAKKDAEKLINE